MQIASGQLSEPRVPVAEERTPTDGPRAGRLDAAFYAEAGAGGFTRFDGSVEGYGRVNRSHPALLMRVQPGRQDQDLFPTCHAAGERLHIFLQKRR